MIKPFSSLTDTMPLNNPAMDAGSTAAVVRAVSIRDSSHIVYIFLYTVAQCGDGDKRKKAEKGIF